MESHHITWKFMQIHLALQAEKEEQNSTLRDPSNFPLRCCCCKVKEETVSLNRAIAHQSSFPSSLGTLVYHLN